MESEHCHTVEEIEAVDNPDFIVGIPSLNEEDTIQFVAEQMARGIKENFPGKTANIINVDNASTDGTKEVFLSSDTQGFGKKYISTAPGQKGKGRNFYNLFHEVVRCEPDAVAVVDSDLTSVETDWADLMLGTVMDGYDLVTPVYKRHQYDGTITNHLCYPLTHGLNGQNVRQPIGGDFAFSTESAKHWLDVDWVESTFYYGTDIFMTTTTIMRGAPVAGARLGRKDHNPSAPRLKEMFKQVAHTLFSLLRRNPSYWNRDLQVDEIDTFGSNEGYKTPELDVDFQKLKREMTNIFMKEKSKIIKFLPEELFQEIDQMVSEGDMDLNANKWSRVIYSALLSFIENPSPVVMEGLLPLYMLRNASFVDQTRGESPNRCDELIVEQARIFHENRDILLEGYSEIKETNSERDQGPETAAAGI